MYVWDFFICISMWLFMCVFIGVVFSACACESAPTCKCVHLRILVQLVLVQCFSLEVFYDARKVWLNEVHQSACLWLLLWPTQMQCRLSLELLRGEKIWYLHRVMRSDTVFAGFQSSASTCKVCSFPKSCYCTSLFVTKAWPNVI